MLIAIHSAAWHIVCDSVFSDGWYQQRNASLHPSFNTSNLNFPFSAFFSCCSSNLGAKKEEEKKEESSWSSAVLSLSLYSASIVRSAVGCRYVIAILLLYYYNNIVSKSSRPATSFAFEQDSRMLAF